MLAFLQAIILGIVEGITEFLPISSTGHVLVAADILGFVDSEEIFTVVIQLGAIGAVMWYFRKDLAARIRGLWQRDPKAQAFWKLLIIATIPVGILGLLFDSYMDRVSTPLIVAITLILGGFILWWIDRKPTRVQNRDAEGLDNIKPKQALLVGLGQCVALIPGVSRAGATIVSGLAVGMDRVTATAFSFYLSIPVMILASGLKLIKHHEAIPAVSGGLASIALGTVVSFIVALAFVAWLLRYVSNHTFRPFAWYRIALGVGILLWLAFLQ